MDSIIQDHTGMKTPIHSRNPASDNDVANITGIGPRSEGDGSESPAQAVSEILLNNPGSVSGSEEVALFDAILCLLGEAFHDKNSWFLDEGFQNVLTRLAGGLLDGYVK